MKKMLFATLAATMFVVVSPAFANPAQEAEEDYAGWKAAREAAAQQQVEQPKGHVIHRSAIPSVVDDAQVEEVADMAPVALGREVLDLRLDLPALLDLAVEEHLALAFRHRAHRRGQLGRRSRGRRPWRRCRWTCCMSFVSRFAIS